MAAALAMTSVSSGPSGSGEPTSGSPAVRGSRRCRMHGGSAASGAPRGNRNAWKHGAFTARMRDLARYLRAQYSTRPAWALDASDVAKYRKETPAP